MLTERLTRWLPRITMAAALVVSARFEYSAGVALNLGWAAAAVPVMVDAYAIGSVLTGRDIRGALAVLWVSVTAGAVHLATQAPDARPSEPQWLAAHAVLAGVVAGLVVTIVYRVERAARLAMLEAARARDVAAAAAARERAAAAAAAEAAAERARAQAEADREVTARAAREQAWRDAEEARAQRDHEAELARIAADRDTRIAATRDTPSRPRKATGTTRRRDTARPTAGTRYPDVAGMAPADRVEWLRTHLAHHPDWSVREWAEATGVSRSRVGEDLKAARRPHVVNG